MGRRAAGAISYLAVAGLLFFMNKKRCVKLYYVYPPD